MDLVEDAMTLRRFQALTAQQQPDSETGELPDLPVAIDYARTIPNDIWEAISEKLSADDNNRLRATCRSLL